MQQLRYLNLPSQEEFFEEDTSLGMSLFFTALNENVTTVNDKYRKWRMATFIQNEFKNESENGNYENVLVTK